MATLLPDCTQSLPTGTPFSTLSFRAETPAQAFLQDQLTELQAIDRWLTQLDEALRQTLDACLAGRLPLDVFTGVVLIRLWHDVHRLEAQTDQLVQQSGARLAQASIRYERLYGKGVDHD